MDGVVWGCSINSVRVLGTLWKSHTLPESSGHSMAIPYTLWKCHAVRVPCNTPNESNPSHFPTVENMAGLKAQC